MGRLYAIIGPSGSGKTTLANKVFPERQLISFTTRKRRVDDGEIDGVDYYFISQREALKLINNGETVENVKVKYGNETNYYGITKAEVENKLSSGDAAVVVNRDGYQHFKESEYGYNLQAVFLDASRKKVIKNLESRVDDPEKIEERLAAYDIEAANKAFFIGEGAIILNADKDIDEVADQLLFHLETNIESR